MKNQLVVVAGVLLMALPAGAQESALAGLRATAHAAPKDASAQLAYGRGLMHAGRLKEAEAQMKRAARLIGGVEGLYEVARVKFASGNYRAARAYCAELRKEDAKHVLTHTCMARAFLVWRRASRAMEHVDKALAVGPGHYEALLALADARRMEGKVAEAREAYQRAASADPTAAAPYLGLGRLELVFGSEAAARGALSEAYKRDASDPEILLELGRVSHGKEAVKLLQQAIAARPSSPEAKLALGRAQLKAGDAAGAEGTLRAVLAKQPSHPAATALLGAVLVEAKKLDEAEQVLAKALELNATDYEAAFALAKLYEAQSRLEEAFNQYRAAAEVQQKTSEPLIYAARLGLRMKRHLLASAILDKALERSPNSAEALTLYGDVLAARGDGKRARDFYKRALAGQGPVDRAGVQAKLRALK